MSFPPAKAMIPLFEAISNAIDAIEEHGNGFHTHSIRIRLVAVNDLAYQGGDKTFVVDGFDIADDGVGFNDKNVASFQEAHTLSKVKIGGKGVGRFTFLKVFSSIQVRSVFGHQGKALLREFGFSIQDELKGAETVTEVQEPCGTQVSMRGMKDKYKSSWPKDPGIIAEKIIVHFLIRFAARSCPPMVLESAGHASIDLHKLFETTILTHIQE